MKRNIFDNESSEEEPEVKKTKKLPVGSTDDASVPTEPGRRNSTLDSGSESDIDYMTMELQDTTRPADTTAPKKASINTPITSSIGLQMMQKMGFKLGDSLGKQNTAILEPISVKVKTDRKGIGATKVPHTVTFRPEEYRMTAKEKLDEAKNRKYLLQLQRFCLHESGDDIAISEGLDVEKVNILWREVARGVLKNAVGRMLLFGEDEGQIDQTGSQDDNENDNQIQNRSDNQNDNQNDDKNEQYVDNGPDSRENSGPTSPIREGSQAPKDFDAFTVTEQLHLLISYTRETFFYCPFCSVQYESKESLLDECPGPLESDHAESL